MPARPIRDRSLESYTCNSCNKTKNRSEFYIHKKGVSAGYVQARCKPCKRKQAKAWWDKNKAHRLAQQSERRLKTKYGISHKEYLVMLEKQGGVCGICKEYPEDNGNNNRRLSIDHCHKTGDVRGLLCSSCNLAIGLLRDNPTLLNSAIQYLENDPWP